jgi:hypothetical protein
MVPRLVDKFTTSYLLAPLHNHVVLKTGANASRRRFRSLKSLVDTSASEARSAMRGGAVDLLTRPRDEDASIQLPMRSSPRHVLPKEAEDATTLRTLYQSLMPREQELLPLVARGLFKKAGGGNPWHYRIHRAGASRPYHEKNARGFICHSRQAGKQVATRNLACSHVGCLTPTLDLCETP